MSDVSGVQRLQFALKFDEVLAMHQVFDKILMLPFLTLTMRQILDDPVPVEQLDDLRQTILETFLRLFCFNFSHGALHPQRLEHARGSIIQNVIGKRGFYTTTGQIHEADPEAQTGGPRNNTTATVMHDREIQAIQSLARRHRRIALSMWTHSRCGKTPLRARLYLARLARPIVKEDDYEQTYRRKLLRPSPLHRANVCCKHLSLQ